jgi:ABC-type Fe3+-hydroxamate transport system substrate-binding protein
MVMMKLTTFFLGALTSSVSLFVAADISVPPNKNPSECLDSLPQDGSTDLFPDKVSPKDSKYWTIEYYNTYKVVTNLETNSTYVLYACGTTPPAADAVNSSFAVSSFIPIPLKTNVALTQTVSVTYIEQLGAIDTVTMFTTDTQYLSSPCFRQLVQDGKVLVGMDTAELVPETDRDDTAGLFPDFFEGVAEGAVVNFTTDIAVAALTNNTVFLSAYELDSTSFGNPVVVSEYKESSSVASFEWIKFYAAFFNLEALANTVTDTAQNRFNCIAENAGIVESDSGSTGAAKPVVLWGIYSSYCGGWDMGTCPNYYCEFADACQSTLLSADMMGEINSTACFAQYFSTRQVVEFGKDADVWIYPAPDWEQVFNNSDNKELLSTMKSVKNKQVYDYQGSGENAWFEQRYAEYYEVLDDICHVVGATKSPRPRVFLRNVFTESVGRQEQCVNSTAPLILTDEHRCDVVVGGQSSSASTITSGLIAVVLVWSAQSFLML